MNEHASPALEQRQALEAPRLRSKREANAVGFVVVFLRARSDSMRTDPGSCGDAATDLVPVLLRNTIGVLLLPVRMQNWRRASPCVLVQARNFLIRLPLAGGAS